MGCLSIQGVARYSHCETSTKHNQSRLHDQQYRHFLQRLSLDQIDAQMLQRFILAIRAKDAGSAEILLRSIIVEAFDILIRCGG